MDLKNIKWRAKMLRHHGKHLVKELLGIRRPPPPESFDEFMAIAEHGPNHPSVQCKCVCTYVGAPAEHDQDCVWLAAMCMCCCGNGLCPHCMGDGTNPKGAVDVVG